MSTTISGMSQMTRPQYIESTMIVSEETKNNDFIKISKIVTNGGTLSNTEFQRLLSDMTKLGEDANLSADEQDLLNRFMDLATQVNGAVNNGQNPVNIYISANGDDTVDEWNVFVTQKKQESAFQRKELLTGDAVIDSFSSMQMLALYGNTLVVNMSNETAATLTVMQKLFEKITAALSELQSFLSKMNAFYKSALTANQEKGKKMEEDGKASADFIEYSNATQVDWTKDGLSGYLEKNGGAYPPLKSKPDGFAEEYRGFISFDAEMVPDIIKQQFSETNSIAYRGNDGNWYYRETYAITPQVMEKALQEVSMLISMVLPKDDASANGSFYDVNKGNLTNSITLDTLISDANTKMKLISDLATKMNEQMRQLQNTIDSSKQQFNSAQSMFTQQQNKM